MSRCHHCQAVVPPQARFCPSCGVATAAPAGLAAESATVPAPGARLSSLVADAFTPGQVIAQRYRVIGLLGRGGMGEVYRADDLKLGTAVALKFLPAAAARDAALLARFHAEVRLARAVAHPHVCRVYDIAEVDGRHFLSMEYVDGEDLATLLRRIGRLPADKAVEIARQIAAGLAAAHEKGVLHRDLKPANVMIDGHGRARLTDFGLAVPAEAAAAEVAGTPAYMAPEQADGAPATVQSDLYALGLVLYELFTGHKPFTALSAAEWRRAHAESSPTPPRERTADLDPVVERLILRCLEKDPAQRPRSAAQVALALPGGDPLAAALAAGETPSPEMVAAAGGEGSLAPGRAALLVAMFVALVAAVSLLTPWSTDFGLAPPAKSPTVLKEKAREAVDALGYAQDGGDEATWLRRDYEPLRWLADHLPSTDWRRRLKDLGTPLVLSRRWSPQPLRPANPAGAVRETDPTPGPGDLLVVLDGRGRLREFEATPARWTEDADGDGDDVPLDAVFRLTALDSTRFRAVAPRWLPRAPFDARREWVGTRAEFPELELRLCVATWRGRVAAVAVQGPWAAPGARDPRTSGLFARVSLPAVGVLFVLLCAASLHFARRNLRLGRGDRRGAFRVAAAGFLLQLVWSLPRVHWSAGPPDPTHGTGGLVLGLALITGASLWVAYLALEPYLRRRAPRTLVGWTRVLDGRLRDPLVGRQALYGLVVGAGAAALSHLANALPSWSRLPAQTTIPWFTPDPLWTDTLAPWSTPLGAALVAIGRASSALMLFFLLRLFVSRRPVLVAALTVAGALFALGGENAALETPVAVAQGLLLAWAMVTWGPLALGAAWFAQLLLTCLPLRAGPSVWYAPQAALAWGLLLALVLAAYRVALGGRPALGRFGAES